jgi:dTDP-4-dehydrorhamnose 3,5-epimerase
MTATRTATGLPLGVRLTALTMHKDERGIFTELYRAAWPTGVRPIQWNVVASEANVLRGTHVHIRHDDYLMVIKGRASVGLKDLRRGSPTEGLAALVPMSGERLTAITIPHGVLHGFYFHEPSMHIYAVSEYFDMADELGCHWADPDLGLDWPDIAPMLSARDAGAPPLSVLLARLEPAQPIGAESVRGYS